MAIALTRGLGRFISGLRYQDIPKVAIPLIHTGFTDCVDTMIAGSREPAPQLLKSVLAPAGGEATLLFGAGRASALGTLHGSMEPPRTRWILTMLLRGADMSAACARDSRLLVS